MNKSIKYDTITFNNSRKNDYLMEARRKHFVYLASPFTHWNPLVRYSRYKTACSITGHLLALGYNVISPIAMSYGIERHSVLRGKIDFKHWRRFDFRLIDLCSIMVLLDIKGSKESKGMEEERDYFVKRHTLGLYTRTPEEIYQFGLPF